MSDEAALTPDQALERKRARLLEELAELDRLAELAKLAAKHNFALVELPPQSEKTDPQAAERTVASLAHCYRSDQRSPYQQLRHKTRESYDCLLRRLERDLGADRIGALDKQRLERAHDDWRNVSGVSMAHALVTMLRGLATFGSMVLKDRACRDLRMTLHDMSFPVAKRQTEPLTRDHVIAVRRKAHELGRPSIALAQAFQFDCGLWQKEVIGEWLPKNSEPDGSDVTTGDLKWLRGLRWEKIDQRLVLRHVTSISGKAIEVNLRQARMVLEELMLIYRLDETEVFDRSNLPSDGPVIVCEFSGRPWTTHEFRRWWRKVADACDIPKSVYNMDSRGGNTRRESESHAGNGKTGSIPGQNDARDVPRGDIDDLDLAHVSRH
jgi:hypothetical protein